MVSIKNGISRNANAQLFGAGLYRTGLLDNVRESAELGIRYAPTMSGYNLAKKGVLDRPISESPVLTVEEANGRFGLEGRLQFDSPVKESVAQHMYDQRYRELKAREKLSRVRGMTGSSIGFATEMITGMLDPANIGLSFIPIVGQARFATMVAKKGINRARLYRGVIDGVAGGALGEVLTATSASEMQSDYTAMDSILNVAMGGVLGGALHVGGGYAMDKFQARKLKRLAQSTEETMNRTAIGQLAEGKRVEVQPLLYTDGFVKSVEPQRVGAITDILTVEKNPGYEKLKQGRNDVGTLSRSLKNYSGKIYNKTLGRLGVADNLRSINDFLRNGSSPVARISNDANKLSNIVNGSSLDGQFVVYKSVSKADIGVTNFTNLDDIAGVVIRDDGFTIGSTIDDLSSKPSADNVVMEIRTLDNQNGIVSKVDGNNRIILDKGMEVVVTGNKLVNGRRVITAEVIDPSTPTITRSDALRVSEEYIDEPSRVADTEPYADDAEIEELVKSTAQIEGSLMKQLGDMELDEYVAERMAEIEALGTTARRAKASRDGTGSPDKVGRDVEGREGTPDNNQRADGDAVVDTLKKNGNVTTDSTMKPIRSKMNKGIDGIDVDSKESFTFDSDPDAFFADKIGTVTKDELDTVAKTDIIEDDTIADIADEITSEGERLQHEIARLQRKQFNEEDAEELAKALGNCGG